MSVGVLLSAYNGEKYIINQLESIKEQTYQDFNLYIVDDCSTDNTFTSIEEYIKGNGLNSWFLSKNETNLGWKKNFIKLIEKCQDDIIFLCDQDDYWMRDKLSVMIEIMNDNEEIDLLCSKYVEFYDDSDINNTVCSNEKKEYGIQKITKKNNLLKIDCPGCTYCFRKSISKQAIALWKEYLPHDATLWMSAFLNHSLYVLNRPCIYWRQHKESVYGGNRVHSTAHERHQFIEQYKDFFAGLQDILNKSDNTNYANSDKNKKLINRYIHWLDCRYMFVIKHHFSYLIKLVRYLDLYPTAANFAGDILDSLKF